MARDRTGAKLPPHFLNVLLKHRNSINDNYCAQFVTGKMCPVIVAGQMDFCVQSEEKCRDKNSVICILSCCFSCTFCRRVAAKETRNSQTSNTNKICERCFLCKSVEFCTTCHKCTTCCSKSSCRVKIARVLGEMGSARHQPKGGISPETGLQSTLPVQTLPDKRTHNNKLLCRSSQERLPVGSIASAVKQKCCRIGLKSTVPGFLQPGFPCTKAQQPVAPYLGSEQSKPILENTVFQNEDPETMWTSLQAGEWVTSLDFKDAYFHISLKNQSRKYMRFHIQDKTYQFKALPFGLSTAPM